MREVVHFDNIKLSDVGPFEDLFIEFADGPGINLICGDNGIGKTTILETIVAMFSRGAIDKISRRQPASKAGTAHLTFRAGESLLDRQIELQEFSPGLSVPRYDISEHARDLINIRVDRRFGYVSQNSISRDPSISNYEYSDRVSTGLDGNEIKSWFANRYLFRHHADTDQWPQEMRDNLQSAIGFFSLLDSNVSLKTVDTRTFDIIVETPSGNIPYEYLSSGFRSAYILLLGILKEIEFRDLKVSASQFNGVILIDEIDLHLHPIWQREIAIHLKRAFPCAQIIATTHSPHVIQSAEAREVIALFRTEEGYIRQRDLVSNRFGYAGWSIEEILQEIMGVDDTHTTVFRAAMRRFDDAIDTENSTETISSLKDLRDMLHPTSSLRKLLEIQAAPFIGDSYGDGSTK